MLVAGTVGCAASRTDVEATPSRGEYAWVLPAPDESLRYNEWTDIACHNCYYREVERFSDAFQRTRTFEIDIIDRPIKNAKNEIPYPESSGKEKIWYVRHDNDHGSNHNRCGVVGGKSTDLRGCLRRIQEFMEPDSMLVAPVLTLYLDLKTEEWSKTHDPESLDTLILNTLGPERVFRPAQMLPPGDSTMATAVRREGWPQMAKLKGKVVVVLTGGTGMGLNIFKDRLIRVNHTLLHYVTVRGSNAAAFVAPEVVSDKEVRDVPGFPPHRDGYAVFFNYNRLLWGAFGSYETVGGAVQNRRSVGRIWWTKDSTPPRRNICIGTRSGFQHPTAYAIAGVRPCPAPARKPSAPTGGRTLQRDKLSQ